MKRFAAHYLFIPSFGFLRQYVVEISDKGVVVRVYPLVGEMSSVEWYSGVIAILPRTFGEEEVIEWHVAHQNPSSVFSDQDFQVNYFSTAELYPFLFSPFDFTSMCSCVETQRILLQ